MIKICRSYSRKISLGNYEMADFFASRDIELPDDTGTEVQHRKSCKLHSLCVLDVERDVEEYKNSRTLEGQESEWSEVIKMVNSFSVGEPVGVEDFSKLVVGSLKSNVVQAVKRAYNRSPLAKDKVVGRSPDEILGKENFKEDSHKHALKR